MFSGARYAELKHTGSVDLSSLELRNINFKCANLHYCNLSNCDLTNCIFERADMYKANCNVSQSSRSTAAIWYQYRRVCVSSAHPFTQKFLQRVEKECIRVHPLQKSHEARLTS